MRCNILTPDLRGVPGASATAGGVAASVHASAVEPDVTRGRCALAAGEQGQQEVFALQG
jgi:hypothetical protein